MSLLSAGFCAWLNQVPPDELDEFDGANAVQLLAVDRLNINLQVDQVWSRDRFRLVLSDGVHYVPALLSPHLNDLVHFGDMVEHAIVVVDRVHCVAVRDMRIIIVYDLHVISRNEKQIGNPVAAPTSSAADTID